MKMKNEILCAGLAALAVTANAFAGVSYTTAGSTYAENFNSLPLVPAPGGTSGLVLSNNTIMAGTGAGYTTGWVNDSDYLTTADPLDIGIKGLHLFHALPTAGTTQAGPSGHARYVQGNGSTAGAGGFWGFNSGTVTTLAAYAEKAIGSVATSVGATAFANGSNPMRIAFEFTNNTADTLTQFTLTYDGEQYMDGRFATAETLAFSYSLTDTASSYQSTWGNALYTPVPALNFTAPNAQNHPPTGTAIALVVDGNLPENRVADISATITGINWTPGLSLFLLWTDTFVGSGLNDGLAIDNIRFSANVPEPTSLTAMALVSIGALARRRRRQAR